MQVAQLTQHYRPIVGGQEIYIKNLTELLHAAGHNSVICQLNRGNAGIGDDTLQVPRVPFAGRLLPGIDSYQLAILAPLLCNSALRASDAIIAHYAISALCLGRFREKTIVLSHGVEWRTENKGLEDRLRERIAHRSFDKFLHVTNDTHYLRMLGMDIRPGTGYFQEVAKNKWFIPNCVNPDHFVRREPLREFVGKRVIFVPRQITPDRGIDLAIRAFSIAARNHPDLMLFVAGKAPSAEYFQYLKSIAEEVRVAHQVQYSTPIPNEKMPAYYSSMTATLIPTLRREGTSLSALESMACGTPTVSTDVCGLADLPSLKAPPQAAPLAELIELVLANGPSIGNEQAEIVRDTFNTKRWAEAWLNVLHQAAGA